MRLPNPRSLRTRLLLLAAVSIGITLVVAAASLVVMFERHMLRRIAMELDVRWIDLAATVTVDGNDAVAISRPLADPRYSLPLSGAYWVIRGENGTLLRSRSLWDKDLDLPNGPPSDAAFEIPGFEPGTDFYVVAKPLVVGSEQNPQRLLVAVALDHAEIAALSGEFAEDLAGAMLVIAAALFAGAWLQADLGLRPLERVRGAVQAIRTGDRPRLGGGYPTEVQPLADDLDRLLDRQDMLIDKARDRAGALAHGFKTPLTILTLESRRLQEAGQLSSARVLREQVESMRRHVERELARARIRGAVSGSSALGAAQSTDLRMTVVRLVDLVRRMPYADGLDFRVEIAPGTMVRMDRDDLGEILGNLLDNARKFANGRVTVRAVPDGTTVAIAVVDDGPGFGAVGDSRNADGSGLGLGIVEDVLEAYGTALVNQRVDDETVLSFKVPVSAGDGLRVAAG